MAALDTDENLAVYIHWPFCAAKCPYCDFNSHVRQGGVDQPSFVEALKQELVYFREQTGRRRVTSVFFGGGTPSLMEVRSVSELLGAVDDLWGLGDEVEITLEANPTSIEADRFKGYWTAGVNRVSIGVQALNDKDLKALGRLHSAEEARNALDIGAATFPRFSVDLIYARMGQTLRDWESELSEAIDLGTKHLSLYQLTIEEGTPFEALHRAGKIVVPEEDAAADFYDLTQDMMNAAGLLAYEVSNHATPGEESQHNLSYWTYADYVGAGPGAHGRYCNLEGKRVATEAIKSPEAWRERVQTDRKGLHIEREVLNPEAASELLMMGLRLSDGADLERFERMNGAPIPEDFLADMEDAKLINRSEGRILTTEQGRLVLNRLTAELLAHAQANLS